MIFTSPQTKDIVDGEEDNQTLDTSDSKNSSPLRPVRSQDGKKEKEKFRPTEYQVEHYKSVIAKLKVRQAPIIRNFSIESALKFLSTLTASCVVGSSIRS